MLAAYLAGNATSHETALIIRSIEQDATIRETLRVMSKFENENTDVLPILAMAARNEVVNLCAIRCESYALKHFGISITESELIRISKENGWLTKDGVALQDIGSLCALYGLDVWVRFGCSIESISFAINDGYIALAPVDGSELFEDDFTRHRKDVEQGQHLNHVVIVDSLSTCEICICDSATPHRFDTYSFETFEDAWADSGKCLICIKK